MHVGKKEVLALIELMEGRFDELLLFDPSLYGLEGRPSTQVDPQQRYGVRGKVPKPPPKKLKDVRTLRSDNLGFQHQYELKATEDYLRANSEDPAHPLTLFSVGRRLYWTLVQ